MGLFKRIRQVFICILIVSLFCAIEGHVLLVKSFAWARMSIHFMQKDDFSISTKKTFDGRHLCPICKALMQKQASRPKIQTMESRHIIENIFPPTTNILIAQFDNQGLHHQKEPLKYSGLLIGPPTPPPKV